MGWDICVAAGSAGVKGAVVGGPTYMGQGTSVKYDTNLGTIKPTLELDDGVLPPPITFIKVSVHEVAVNNSENRNIQPASGLAAGATPSVVGMDGSHASAGGLQMSTAAPRQAATATRRSPLAA